MIAKTEAFSLTGLSGIPVTVEVDVSNGLPRFDLVGLADTAVKEAKERVCSAIKNSGRIKTQITVHVFAAKDVIVRYCTCRFLTGTALDASALLHR